MLPLSTSEGSFGVEILFKPMVIVLGRTFQTRFAQEECVHQSLSEKWLFPARIFPKGVVRRNKHTFEIITPLNDLGLPVEGGKNYSH